MFKVLKTNNIYTHMNNIYAICLASCNLYVILDSRGNRIYTGLAIVGYRV